MLIVDRAVAFPGVDLSAVTSFSIEEKKGNGDLLTASIDAATAPFFLVGEPGAFTLSRAPALGDELVVSVKPAQGAAGAAQLTVTAGAGLYLDTALR